MSSLDAPTAFDANDHSPYPIIRLDGEGNLIDANQAARRLGRPTGRPLEESLPVDAGLITAGCLESGHSVKNRVVSRRGRTLNWTFVPDLDSGVVWGYGFDLSGAIPTDEEAREADVMDSVRRMAAGISHDFNNILTVIKGYTDLVLADPGLPESNRDPLERVSLASDQAARLVSRLMAFSQQQVLDRRDCELNAIVSSVLERHEELPLDHIRFEIDATDDLPLVRGDAELLEEAVECLVTNAVEAMPTGGCIRVQTRARVAQGPEGAHTWVVIAVEDDGKGIEGEVMKRIFDPYFTTRRTGRGTGLGLAAANGIIRQHGGRIEAESTVQVGSRFCICLPAKIGT